LASSSPLSAGTVIALIFTTVMFPIMPARLLVAVTGARAVAPRRSRSPRGRR
jgi:hypothetical protein